MPSFYGDDGPEACSSLACHFDSRASRFSFPAGHDWTRRHPATGTRFAQLD
jgi:predicted CxxxxCH...CXXCH cytochrome family protein